MANITEITTREAAQRLGVSQRHVARYVKRGKLKARKTAGGMLLIKVSDLGNVSPGRAPTDPLITDEFLREIVKLYRAAVAGGTSPRAAIAERYDRNLRTADRWIAAARERNLLGDWQSEKRR